MCFKLDGPRQRVGSRGDGQWEWRLGYAPGVLEHKRRKTPVGGQADWAHYRGGAGKVGGSEVAAEGPCRRLVRPGQRRGGTPKGGSAQVRDSPEGGTPGRHRGGGESAVKVRKRERRPKWPGVVGSKRVRGALMRRCMNAVSGRSR